MPRANRVDVGGVVYHVINRSNARLQIFLTNKDYELFEKVLEEGKEKFAMRILAYIVMPNHWHLVLHPHRDGDLQKFMRWISMTHTQRWHSQHKSIGSGHLYQGRYKSFPIQTNTYLLQIFRYVERNALRAKLVKKAEDWRWSSLWCRESGTPLQQKLFTPWPIIIPRDYLTLVNNPQTNTEVESVRYSVNKGKPYGTHQWVSEMIDTYKLESTLRNPGRPNKGS